jgi:hypothetical protein
MKILTEKPKFPYFFQFSVFKNDGNKFNGQNHQIAGNAKGHLHQHGVNVGVPENEPSANGLTDINTQHGHGAGIADKPDDDSCIDNAFKFLSTHDIGQKARKKSTRAQCNYREVENDPQRKGKHVAHIGLIQPLPQT